jgi:hypothetical protein
MKIKAFVITSYIVLEIMLILAYGAYIDTIKILETQQKTIKTQHETIVEFEKLVDRTILDWCVNLHWTEAACLSFYGRDIYLKTLINPHNKSIDVLVCRYGKCKEYTYKEYFHACEAQKMEHDRFWKTYDKRTIIVEDRKSRVPIVEMPTFDLDHVFPPPGIYFYSPHLGMCNSQREGRWIFTNKGDGFLCRSGKWVMLVEDGKRTVVIE